MRGTLCIGAFRNTATVITTALFLGGCLMQDKIDDDDIAASAAIEAEFELSGSVGDGPVVGALMRIMRNDGVLLNELESDASAGYNIVVKTKGKHYPLTVDARGGIDIVTNLSPDFVLLGAALEPSKKVVVNVNPYSTLAMEIATDLPGGRTKSNIYTAQDIAVASMNNGLVSLVSSGPMTTKINSSNVAEVVKTSEALGEIVRRTRDWLLTAGFVWDGDAVIGAMGSDLVDSVIDGAGGPRSDARMAAITTIVTAQVLLESMSNELHVNGAHATASLEAAIQMMNLGTASPALGELNTTSAMLAQINIGLAAADAISDDARVTSLYQSVAGFQPGMQPTLARSVLTPDYRQILDDVLQLLIGGDATTIATVNEVVRNGGDIPGDEPPPDDPPADEPPPVVNTPPAIAGTPPTAVTVNTAYDFTPIASDADNNPLSFTVAGLPTWATFNSTNGRISGTPGDAHVANYSGIVITVSDGTASAGLGPFSIAVNAISLGAATLNWQPPTQNEDGTALLDLAGYRLYWGPPGNRSNSVTINNPGITTYIIENLAPGSYEFVSTAFNSVGMESQFSNSAMKTVQ